MLSSYDPDRDPAPAEWLALDEADRIERVHHYHRRAARGRRPTSRLHATVHVIVENQLAAAWAPTVDALARLRHDGLSRHDAIHAIGSVVAAHMNDVLRGGAGDADPHVRYAAVLRALTADGWRRQMARH